jgi:hypothetical protein
VTTISGNEINGLTVAEASVKVFRSVQAWLRAMQAADIKQPYASPASTCWAFLPKTAQLHDLLLLNNLASLSLFTPVFP